MSHKRLNNREQVKRLSRRMTYMLAAAIAALVLLCLVLGFKLGYGLWPAWLIDNRGMFMGLLGLAILALAVFSPAIIAIDSNPRPLSGPGKNPETGPGNK